MVGPPPTCQMSVTTAVGAPTPQCETISSPWYDSVTAAWAASVSSRAASGLPAGRGAAAAGPAAAGLAAAGSAAAALAGSAAALAAAALAAALAAAALAASGCWRAAAAPSVPAHAVTISPGTAIASAAAARRASRRVRSGRCRRAGPGGPVRLVCGQVSGNTRTSRLLALPGRRGRRRARERDLAGGDRVLDAVHVDRRGDPGARRCLARAADRERGGAQADHQGDRADYHVAAPRPPRPAGPAPRAAGAAAAADRPARSSRPAAW